MYDTWGWIQLKDQGTLYNITKWYGSDGLYSIGNFDQATLVKEPNSKEVVKIMNSSKVLGTVLGINKVYIQTYTTPNKDQNPLSKFTNNNVTGWALNIEKTDHSLDRTLSYIPVMEEKNNFYKIAIPHTLPFENIEKSYQNVDTSRDGVRYMWIKKESVQSLQFFTSEEQREKFKRLVFPNNNTSERSIEVVQIKLINNIPWVQIKLMGSHPCLGGSAPKIEAKGWIPFYGKDDSITILSAARGC
jgi:hypothetical protein